MAENILTSGNDSLSLSLFLSACATRLVKQTNSLCGYLLPDFMSRLLPFPILVLP